MNTRLHNPKGYTCQEISRWEITLLIAKEIIPGCSSLWERDTYRVRATQQENTALGEEDPPQSSTLSRGLGWKTLGRTGLGWQSQNDILLGRMVSA